MPGKTKKEGAYIIANILSHDELVVLEKVREIYAAETPRMRRFLGSVLCQMSYLDSAEKLVHGRVLALLE